MLFDWLVCRLFLFCLVKKTSAGDSESNPLWKDSIKDIFSHCCRESLIGLVKQCLDSIPRCANQESSHREQVGSATPTPKASEIATVVLVIHARGQNPLHEAGTE